MTWQQIQDEISKIDWGIITGVIALFFTAISLQIQRKHNRLSVKPIADVMVGDYENELEVYIENKGTGPLIIKNLSFTNQDGKTEKAINNFFGSDFKNVVWDKFGPDIDKRAILPNESITLIKLSGKSANKSFVRVREKVRKVLTQIQVEWVYQYTY